MIGLDHSPRHARRSGRASGGGLKPCGDFVGEVRFAASSTGITGLVVTSQLAVDKWHVMVGDPTYADAILDRIAHNSHRVTLEGDSIRKTKGRQSKSGNCGGIAAGARDS